MKAQAQSNQSVSDIRVTIGQACRFTKVALDQSPLERTVHAPTQCLMPIWPPAADDDFSSLPEVSEARKMYHAQKQCLGQFANQARASQSAAESAMPGMSGVQLVRTMRGAGKLCRIPVLMLTARQSGTDERLAFAAGADDYLRKPVDLDLLVGRVDALLFHANKIQATG